jgi:hypothetical protein
MSLPFYCHCEGTLPEAAKRPVFALFTHLAGDCFATLQLRKEHSAQDGSQ